ncbi:MAG: hypothetical protein O8C67_04975 [Candidatus Methanoperedens sp.]|nr:hypothetical protein [Candidatus Methanoperedens sp.]
MDREVCGILAKNIGAEDEVQSAYDNLADFIEKNLGDKNVPIVTIVEKLREIAKEERTHKSEFNEIYMKLNCHLNTDRAKSLTTDNY